MLSRCPLSFELDLAMTRWKIRQQSSNTDCAIDYTRTYTCTLVEQVVEYWNTHVVRVSKHGA